MTIPSSIFRAYDIRGLYPQELTAESARLIGQGFGTYVIRVLKSDSRFRGNDAARVVVGRDGRLHSPELQKAFIEGLVRSGCHVTNIGLTPSPLLYFSNTVDRFDAGCNITASHNPKEYNGFKLILAEGHAVYGDDIQKIRRLIEARDFESGKGRQDEGNFLNDYETKIHSMFDVGSKKPLKVVVDTAGGVAGAFYPKILKALGYEVIGLYTDLNGSFPYHEPDPIVEKNLEDLKRMVLSEKADLGLGFDGDGDRVGLITDQGEFITADRVLMMLTRDVLLRHPKGTLVYTVSNSQLLFDLAREWGGNPVMCPVGHSYVENAMHEYRAILGGEQSGHFFLPEDYFGYDDALVTACRLLKIVEKSGKSASELFKEFPKPIALPEIRPECPDDKKFAIIERIKAHFKDYPHETMDGIRVNFGHGGWAGIRASNTSPRLSVIMEGETPERLEKIKKTVMEHLRTYPEIKFYAP